MVTSIHPLPLFEWVMCIQAKPPWICHIYSIFEKMGRIHSNFTNGSYLFNPPPSTNGSGHIYSNLHIPRMDHVCSNFHPPWIISIQTSTLLEWVISIQTSTQMDHIIIHLFKPQRMNHFYSDHIQIIAIQTSTNGSCLDVFKQFLFPCVLKGFS